MANRELKKILTDLAAGHITKQEADTLIKPKKTHQKRPVQEIEGEEVHTKLNAKGGKK